MDLAANPSRGPFFMGIATPPTNEAIPIMDSHTRPAHRSSPFGIGMNHDSPRRWSRDIPLSPVSSRVLQGPTQSSIPILSQITPSHTSRRQRQKNRRPCYILIIIGVITIILSLGAALWRSAARHDVSGGFSLGQYILGVGVFVDGTIAVIHSKTCKCWQ